MTIGLQTAGFGQSLSGQVFMLTEHFVEDKCEVIAECDCCSADLFFLNENEFGLVSRCLNADSYYMGRYAVKGDKLILTFKQKVINEIIDEETNKEKTELKAAKVEPYQFAIAKCGGKVRLQCTRVQGIKNGSRYPLAREKKLTEDLKMSVAWKLVSQ